MKIGRAFSTGGRKEMYLAVLRGVFNFCQREEEFFVYPDRVKGFGVYIGVLLVTLSLASMVNDFSHVTIPEHLLKWVAFLVSPVFWFMASYSASFYFLAMDVMGPIVLVFLMLHYTPTLCLKIAGRVTGQVLPVGMELGDALFVNNWWRQLQMTNKLPVVDNENRPISL